MIYLYDYLPLLLISDIGVSFYVRILFESMCAKRAYMIHPLFVCVSEFIYVIQVSEDAFDRER